MLKDWQIGESGHSGYGKWQIEQKSATEFESVTSHTLNQKVLSFSLEELSNPEVLPRVQSINFTCKVRGVPPNCADKYRVNMKLLLAGEEV